jgi:hypothetical protein
VLPPLLAGPASLNSRLGNNLQQAIIHIRSSAEPLSPAEPVRTLPPRGGSLPAPQPGRLETFL